MIDIREERPKDIDAIHYAESQAFGRPNEADPVDALRRNENTILSLVAMLNERIVGHILFSPAVVESPDKRFNVAALGPVAALPERQNEGIGGRLAQSGLSECLQRGYDVVFLIGHPNYYPRFGFVPAATKGFRYEREAPDGVFMAAELRQGALASMRGRHKVSA